MKSNFLFFSFAFIFSGLLFSQEETPKAVQSGHKNNNNFKQLYEEFSTPNRFRTASGAPGIDYYQQQVDYIMNIELDDQNKKLYGEETITYTNNSPDDLAYLWLQLDQNIRKKDAPALEKNTSSFAAMEDVESFVEETFKEPFDGGFNIEYVKDSNGKPLRNTINQTMMRVDLPTPPEKWATICFFN